MHRIEFAPIARNDLVGILAWSLQRFGAEAQQRYLLLIRHALHDIGENPDRPGCKSVSELSVTARVYHLRHSRDRVSESGDRVRHPRHFILFRVKDSDAIEVGRFLHDSMDLEQHFPDDFTAE